MTTAAVRTTANYHHNSDQPEIVEPSHMHRRSFAPTNFGDYPTDQKTSGSGPDSYNVARSAPSSEKPAWAFSPGQTAQHQSSQQKQPSSYPRPSTASEKTSNAVPSQQQGQQQQQQSRSSGQSSSNARRDINSRHPGQRERREQRIGDFIIKQTLGKGTFSKVCMAEHRATKQKFALKFIKPNSPQGGSTDKHNIRVEREIKLLSLLYHPNIVRLYDVVQTPKFTMIVMEHNSGGELLHYIRKRGRLHENEARGFFRQIVSAMDYTHRNCIIHRDLKLENVMLDHENRIRIIDYGFANTFEWDKQLSTFCGSPFYAAPEMVNGIKYIGPEVDIWSMGVILFFMLCGRTPFEGENLKEIYDKISRGRFTMPPFLSKEAQSLLQQMLTVNPKHRISMRNIVDHPWSNKDCDQPIDNHLPTRPTVVLQPNEQSLQKMRVYKYEVDAVASALAHSDMALTPMVCIYHLVEESRRRKASRNARKSHATSLGVPSGNGSTVDVDHVSPVPPHASAPPASTSPSAHSAQSAENARPISRGRHNYAPGHNAAENYSPTNRGASANSDPRYKPQPSVPQGHAPVHVNIPVPQPHYLSHKESDIGANLESPSFGASQYEPPRLRKGSTASGQLSVSSSINLEASSPFLREDDKRSSRSSRFFDRVRKSMPFLKARRSQIMDDLPPFQQSQNPVGSRNNRVSFFQAPFRRFSAAPSALSLNQSPGHRVQSYYPPSNPPPQSGQAQQRQFIPYPEPQQRNYPGARPATANVENRPTAASNQRPSTSGGHHNHHRYTDFGPVHQSPSPRLNTADGGERHRKSEPPQGIPYEANSNANSDGVPVQKRAQRPLSVVSNRQVTPLRLHPTQSMQNNQAAPPFTQQVGAVQQLPAALTTRSSAPTGVSVGSQASPNSSNGNKSNVRGIFNLRYTMLGPLGEIHAKVERVLKSKAIVVRKMADAFYSCEDHGLGLSFEIFVDTVQGQLHTIRFKRIEGSWWAYKKLTVAITNDLQGLEFSG